MSMTMPPGWYPDPGHAGEGPPPERWWDGTTWTGRTRPAGTTDERPAEKEPGEAVDAGGGSDRTGEPGGDTSRQPGNVWGAAAGSTPASSATDQPWLLPEPLPEDTEGTARRAWRFAGIAAAVLVGGALVTGGVLLAAAGTDDGAAVADDGGAGEDDDPAPGDDPEAGGDPDRDGDGGPDTPEDPDTPDDAGEFTDARVAEVLLPIPEGWSERSFTGAAVTAGEYPCPGDAQRTCVQAGAFLEEAEGDDPQSVAEEDIEDHVATSYAQGTHGDVVNQQQERAEEVTVAGGAGYRVRLRVETGDGTEAYAESVAFVAPDDSGRTLVLRLGWADAPDAPSGEDMDDLVGSVRSASPSGAGTEV